MLGESLRRIRGGVRVGCVPPAALRVGGRLRASWTWQSCGSSFWAMALLLRTEHRSRPRRNEADMPEFMDVHTTMKGVTPEALAEAHNADLAIQDDEGVNFKQAWADPESGMVFCLSEAPNAEAVKKIHERTGHPADDVYPITLEV